MHWADRRASVAVPDSVPGRPNDWNCPIAVIHRGQSNPPKRTSLIIQEEPVFVENLRAATPRGDGIGD